MTGAAIYPRRNFSFSLDTPAPVPISSDEAYLTGWFVPDPGTTYELLLVVEGRQLPVFTELPRPDVGRHHGNDPRFKNSGFIAHFIRPGSEVQIRLIARAGDVEFVLADLTAPPADSSLAIPALPSAIPSIVVVVAVPDSHPYLISRCIESIRRQSYSHWQLCAGCEPHPSASRAYLERVAAEDSRIKLVIVEGEACSELYDQALQNSEAAFVLRLDYRDELEKSALAEVASSIQSNGALNIVYADEQETDFYGRRTRSISKPDFDLEAFASWNFIGRGAALRRSSLLEAGGYLGDGGTVDEWTSIRRMLGILQTSEVHHIPKPLYLRRQGDDQVAPLPRKEPCPSAKSLSGHLARTSKKVAVEAGLFPGSLRLRHEQRAGVPVAILIRAEGGVLQHAALAANIDPRTTSVYELLGSGADLLMDSRAPEKVQADTVRDLSEIPAEVFIFVNGPLDTVNHHFVDELTEQAMREDCGLATGIALDADGRILHSGFLRRPANGVTDLFAGLLWSQTELASILNVVRSVDLISDKFFAVKRSQLLTIGGLRAISSTRMSHVLNELAELAHSTGLRVLVTPYAVATFDLTTEDNKPNKHASNAGH